MPLTTIFNKAFAKVILQLLGGGSVGYGLWLLNPLNDAQAASVIKFALSAGSLEIIVGCILLVAATWFIVAVHKENLRQMRITSMTMMILWAFFFFIYLFSNAFLAVLPLSLMFSVIFGYCFIKTPKSRREPGR